MGDGVVFFRKFHEFLYRLDGRENCGKPVKNQEHSHFATMYKTISGIQE